MVKFIGEYDIISGSVMMEQASPKSPVKIRGVIYGLEAGKHSIHIHTGTTLGERCENVGRTFTHEKSDRTAGFLGNVKVINKLIFFLISLPLHIFAVYIQIP
jgi:hypothetical protein